MGTVDGSVVVKMTLNKETGLVVMHCGSNLKVLSSSVKYPVNGTDAVMNHKQIYHYTDNEYVVVQYPQRIASGSVIEVTLNYTGTLIGADMRGLYTSTYLDPTQGNKAVAILASQFQSTDARSAFPCMDEPALKATFDVTVVIDRIGIEVLSNTALESTGSSEDGRVSYKFLTTPVMSTYLVAIVVAPGYEKITGTFTAASDIPVTVYVRPGQAEYARFALDATLKALATITDLASVSYKLTKLDLVAIPDFAAGAMENWGLITFRETSLLVDHATYPSVASQQNVAATIVHELAHQWWGNAVTPKWWSDIWVSEGVATAFEYWVLVHNYPEWDFFTNHIWNEQYRAMQYDAFPSSHSLVADVTKPAEISDLFDVITYAKGSSILNMVAFSVDGGASLTGSTSGPERMITALKLFFDTNVNVGGIVDTTSLWTAVSASLGGFTKDNAVEWMSNPGYPLVTFSYSPSNGYKVVARQERFLFDRKLETPGVSTPVAPNTTAAAPVAPPVPTGSGWWIPLYINGGVGSKVTNAKWVITPLTATMLEASYDVPVNMFHSGNADGWFKANPSTRSYYRCAYPELTFNNIARFMLAQVQADTTSNTPFTEGDRAGFLNDALVLAGANYYTTLVKWSQAFTALEVLRVDRSYATWKSALLELNNIADVLQDQSCFGHLGYYLNSLTKDHITSLGWGNVETQNFTVTAPKLDLLRGVVFDLAAEFDESGALYPAAKQFFDLYMTNASFILPGDIAPAVLKSVLMHGGQKEWDQVLAKYTSAIDAVERIRLLRALGTTQKPYLLTRLLQLSLDTTVIRPQDRAYAIEAVASNRLGGRTMAWNFVRANWNSLYRSGFGVADIILSSTQRLSDSFAYSVRSHILSLSSSFSFSFIIHYADANLVICYHDYFRR
jgi:aminopeptidase N